MKTKEELNVLKEEVETLNKKLAKLTEEELEQVAGGAYDGPVTIYDVKPGDSLSAIAIRFRTTVRTLCEINNFSNPNKIFAGHRIFVPSKD